jgi:putative tryptophan/tyrosine transport system substrate-binding protein
MDRRVFIGTLTGGLLVAPLGAEAQQAGKVYRIGWLAITPRTSSPLQRQSESFLQGLRDRGFVEGQNVIIERRYSEGREDRHTAFVAECVQMKVDLIVTSSSAAAHAAKQATSTIPIVRLLPWARRTYMITHILFGIGILAVEVFVLRQSFQEACP